MKRTVIASSLIVALFYMFGSLQPYLNLFVSFTKHSELTPLFTALWFFLSGFFMIVIMYTIQFQFEASSDAFEVSFIQGESFTHVYLMWCMTQCLHLALGLLLGAIMGVLGSYLWMMTLSLLIQEPIFLVWIFQPDVLYITALFFIVVSCITLLWHIRPLRKKVMMTAQRNLKLSHPVAYLFIITLCIFVYWGCYWIIQLPLGALFSFPIVVPIGYVTTILLMRTLGKIIMATRSYPARTAVFMRFLGKYLIASSKMIASAVVLVMFCMSSFHFSYHISNQMALQAYKHQVFNTDASIDHSPNAAPPFKVTTKQAITNNQRITYISYSTYQTVARAQALEPQEGPYLYQPATQLFDLTVSFDHAWLTPYNHDFTSIPQRFTLSENHTMTHLIVLPDQAFDVLNEDGVVFENQVNTLEKPSEIFDLHKDVLYIGTTTSFVFGALAFIVQLLALSNFWNDTKYAWETPLHATRLQCQSAALATYLFVLAFGCLNGWMAIKGLHVSFGTGLELNSLILCFACILYIVIAMISIGGILYAQNTRLRKIL